MNDINRVFDILDDWREFPKYRLEPRVDVFFAIYLPEIFKRCKLINERIKNDMIFPEFPYIQSKKKKELTCNVDFAVIGDKALYLVELKTNMDSIEEIQNSNMYEVHGNPLSWFLDTIIEPTKKKNKDYGVLTSRINDVPRKDNLLAKIVYILPESPTNENFKSDIVITFDDVTKYLRGIDRLADRFCNSLESWKP